MTRTTLNGQQPRTMRDAGRDPFDWLEGPDKHAAEVRRMGALGDGWIVRLAAGVTGLWLAAVVLQRVATLLWGD